MLKHPTKLSMLSNVYNVYMFITLNNIAVNEQHVSNC